MTNMKQRILDTLLPSKPFLCHLATLTEDGRPWVRTMRGVIGEDLVIRCPTFAGTKKVAQIEANSEIHLTCGDTDPSRPGSYFQIEARAEITQSLEDREAAWTDHLAKWFSGPEDRAYLVVRITPTRITALPIGGGPPAEIWDAST